VTKELSFRIRSAEQDPAILSGLAEVTLDCVAGGASIGFMQPLSYERALSFWQAVLSAVARAERLVLIAEDLATQQIIGTVQLVLHMPDNQPHRADVAKMQVHRMARRRGVGEALVRAIEEEARKRNKTLLVLDTVTDSDAARLYSRLGWQRVGDIPNYALFPQGGLCSTTFFYRAL
jgi:ribosomal protein S18 acetylase RimI-like enzyme